MVGIYICVVLSMILISYNLLHVLNYLIMLELLVLLNFWLMSSYFMSGEYTVIMLMSYLVLVVASASLGLSVLVSICRSHGQDYLSTYNLLF